jgi:hypothetical protein
MAFAKTAQATVVHPVTTLQAWKGVRSKVASTKANIPSNLVEQAGGIFETGSFNPSDYLLTHATIVCSVDTSAVENLRLGSDYVDGFKVNRKYADFRVTPQCDKFINNNNDCWSRPVLGKSFQTFQGAHNFVEHVQLVEQSKGRIIDAVCRDIGDSLYVDILIATDRKFTELVRDIKSGKMATLSMGCTVDFTICTKCGHVAADETELCPHIKYHKGDTFYDGSGKRHRVAELCGHHDVDPTGGVTFIEASWVQTPAFLGAEVRNILEIEGSMSRRVQAVLSEIPAEWDEGRRQKAARKLVSVFGGLFDEDGEDGEDGESEEEPKEESKDRLKTLEDTLYDKMVTKVKKRVTDDLNGPNSLATSADPNNDMQRNAALVIKAGLNQLTRVASNDADLMNRVALLSQAHGMNIPTGLYRVALSVGAVNNLKTWQGRVRQVAGSLDQKQYSTLLGLCRLLKRRASQIKCQQGAHKP